MILAVLLNVTNILKKCVLRVNFSMPFYKNIPMYLIFTKDIIGNRASCFINIYNCKAYTNIMVPCLSILYHLYLFLAFCPGFTMTIQAKS